MGEIEDLKTEFDRMNPVDKRWLVICGGVAITALIFALLIGSVIGDVVAFVLAFGAGWVMRAQWQLIAGQHRRGASAGSTPTKPRSHARVTRRKTATK